METLWQDIVFSARSLRRNALLSAAVIATLTLGIGLSAGIFGYFNAELLRPRLDKGHDSFVRIYTSYTYDPPASTNPRGGATVEDYLAFRDQAKSLRTVAAYFDTLQAPLGHDSLVETRALLVSPSFFDIYDPGPPLLGRLLQPTDFEPASPVVLLSERLWRDRFDGDAQIVGRTVHFNRQPVTVVGVARTSAAEINGARVWFPYTLASYLEAGDYFRKPAQADWLSLAGSLNPGFTRQQAAAELRLLAAHQDRLHPGRTTTLHVTDGSSLQAPSAGQLPWVVATMVGVLTFFVLIVCVNATTLLLARAAGRRQEIATRIALGAGKTRLIRMLLTETALLAGVAGLASVAIAYHLPDALVPWLSNPRNTSDAWSRDPDWRVFGYIAAITALAAVMAGLTPALQSLRVNLSEMLKGRHGISSGSATGSRLYGLLIGSQVALSFFLLFGAVTSVRTLWQAASFDPGFETRNLLFVNVWDLRSSERARTSWHEYHRALAARLTALPGVESVAYTFREPFHDLRTMSLLVPGQAARPVAVNWVSPGYFATLGIPILTGRDVRPDDPVCGKNECSVVVSQRLAGEFWPGESPLGKTLKNMEGDSFEVVGVAGNVSSTRLGGLDDPMIYLPIELGGYPAHVVVRSGGDEATQARAVTSVVRDAGPEVSIRVSTIQQDRQDVLETIARETRLIIVLCVMAVLLAVIGIYGVVSFVVTRRTHELGIRIALGAAKKDVYGAVLGSSGRPIAAGLLAGLVLTLTMSAAMMPLLPQEAFVADVGNPLLYAATALLLTAAALAAMFVPARRAARVDPLVALRYE